MAAPTVASWVPGQPIVEDTPLQPILDVMGFALADVSSWAGMLAKLMDRQIATVGELFDLSYNEALAMMELVPKTRVTSAYLSALETRCGMQFDRGKGSK